MFVNLIEPHTKFGSFHALIEDVLVLFSFLTPLVK